MADEFASSLNPACCGCDDGPPPCPKYTVTVVASGNGSPAGLAVALTGTLDGQPWSAGGTLDASGVYTYTMPTSAPYPLVAGAAVVAPAIGLASGCSASAAFNGKCSLLFSFCRDVVVAGYTVAANPTFSANPGNNLSFAKDGSGTAYWWSCCLKFVSDPANQSLYCAAPNSSVTFRVDDPNFRAGADPQAGYLPRCKTVTLNCSGRTNIDLTQELTPPCYTIGGCGPFPCRDYVGPPYPGARPGKYQVRFTTVPGARATDINGNPTGCGPIFAGHDGVWIDVASTRPVPPIGAAGNYIQGTIGNEFVNCPGPPGANKVTFDHVYVFFQGNTINYQRAVDPASANYDATAGDCSTKVTNGVYRANLCSNSTGFPVSWLCNPGQPPMNVNNLFTVELRDGCGGNGPGTNPSGPGTVAMMSAAPPEAEVALIPVEENVRLTLAASRCPHRTEPDCRCGGVPATCDLGKNGGLVLLTDCIACQRAGGPDGPWPDTHEDHR